MTDDEIKTECERRFQDGHTRTQLVFIGNTENYHSLSTFRSMDSVAQARNYGDESFRIFARRKVGTKYVWKEFK